MGKYTPGWRDRTHEMVDFELSQRRAQLLKFVLPAFVVVLLTATFVCPKIIAWQNNSLGPAFEQRFRHSPELKNKIFGPVFKSLDKNGKPINVQANIATQISQNITAFDKPSGTLFMQDGTWVKFCADTGQHKRETNILELEGNVHITTQDGYDLVTRCACILLTEKQGFGHETVDGVGPIGETVRAEGFTLSNGQKKVTFTGKTNVTYPATSKRMSDAETT